MKGLFGTNQSCCDDVQALHSISRATLRQRCRRLPVLALMRYPQQGSQSPPSAALLQRHIAAQHLHCKTQPAMMLCLDRDSQRPI